MKEALRFYEAELAAIREGGTYKDERVITTPQRARIRVCAYCSMRESCTLRKGGNHCGS